VDVLGIPVARLDLAGVLARVRQVIRSPDRARLRLAYVNAHFCNLFFEDPAYRQALAQADLIYLDGNGPRLAAWLAGDRLPRRTTGADWIHDLCALAEREGFVSTSWAPTRAWPSRPRSACAGLIPASKSSAREMGFSLPRMSPAFWTSSAGRGRISCCWR